MSNYFSDRELGPRARTEQTMSPVAWAGIVVLIEALANSGAFGASFPQECPDGHAICGNDMDMLKSAIETEIAGSVAIASAGRTSWKSRSSKTLRHAGNIGLRHKNEHCSGSSPLTMWTVLL